MYFTAENSHEAFLDVRQTDEWESIRDDPIFVVFSDEDMRTNLVTIEACIDELRERPDDHLVGSSGDRDEEMPDASYSVMDDLEQALSGSNGATQARNTRSPPSLSQEDILAKLGVTGAPKPSSGESMSLQIPEHDAKPPVALPQKPAVVPT